ncbi:MAG: hypothetical protein ACRD1E_02840, partial [Terriglobales bacterium]
LLLFPRTAALGALLALADGAQVFMLNMSYDVPVKLLSFQLIPLALLVLAPDLRRLATAVFSSRPAPPSAPRALFASARANRWALAAQALFACYLIAGNLYGSVTSFNRYGPGRPKSELYGIWQVQSFTLDGQSRPALDTDAERWRRVIFDNPDAMFVQGMDDAARAYPASINLPARLLTLSKISDKSWKAVFRLAQPAPGALRLDGMMDGHHLEIALQLMDRNRFVLTSRGFHWVQDYPFNR